MLAVTSQSTFANGESEIHLVHVDHELIASSINEFAPTPDKPFVLGLPTGSSPIPTYKALIKMVKAGELSYGPSILLVTTLIFSKVCERRDIQYG